MILNLNHPPPGQRISVIGLPGAGKTTLARQLSQELLLPHIELDALYWGPNWTRTPCELFRQQTVEAINRHAWVVEGNHCDVCDLIWLQADTVVWLDLSLPILMTRLLKRTIRNLLTGAEVCNGNREDIKRLLSSDSIFLKLLNGYHSKREAILERLNQPQYSHLHLIHLRTPQSTRTWLANLSTSRLQLTPCMA